MRDRGDSSRIAARFVAVKRHMLKHAHADCNGAQASLETAVAIIPRPITTTGRMLPILRAWRFTALFTLCAALAACATGPNPRDPYEPFNRSVFKFNDAVDSAVTKPIAKGYKAVAPVPVRTGVSNFFHNFLDVTTAINDLLQAKVGHAASDAGRVLINSTIGFFGVFDVATRLGLDKHNEDFGQTLGVWGFKSGPYLVLPFIGPSSARDGIGLVGDYFTDPEFYLFPHPPGNYVVLGVRVINFRSNLLGADQFFDVAAVDRYSFLRDAYLQLRRNQIYDGNPPADDTGETPHRKTLEEQEKELELDDSAPTPPVK
jgi:phospholipid-binding lipoprotein MlaA